MKFPKVNFNVIIAGIFSTLIAIGFGRFICPLHSKKKFLISGDSENFIVGLSILWWAFMGNEKARYIIVKNENNFIEKLKNQQNLFIVIYMY